MSNGYSKQGFTTGQTLEANHLVKMENGIMRNQNDISLLDESLETMQEELDKGQYSGDYNNDTSNSNGYIKNRPFYEEATTIPETPWDGSSYISNGAHSLNGQVYKCIHNQIYDEELLINGTLNAYINGSKHENIPIVGVARTYSEAMLLLGEANSFPSGYIAAFLPGIFFAEDTDEGTESGLTTLMNWLVLSIINNTANAASEQPIPLGTFLVQSALAKDSPEGFYAWKTQNNYVESIQFNNIVISDKYQNFFNSLKSRIIAFNVESEADLMGLVDMSKFRTGDIILITQGAKLNNGALV